MKNSFYGRILPIILNNIIKKELLIYYDNNEIKNIYKMNKMEYKKILKDIPNMGGKESFFKKYMYLGAYVIGLYKLINKKISVEDFKNIIINSYKNNKFIKNLSGKINYFSKKYRKIFIDYNLWANNNISKYPWIWLLNINENKMNENEIYFEINKCGLCELFNKEKVPEIMNIMCDMDYISFEFANINFIRKKTIANGNECCDFLFLRK